ncbi:NUDIX hydrolase [Pseudooctadecabacter sp.]|uniref:NUDIX hydrolase n=1 Tax=Pseudooctadecabacter sp. TaxID=1966338 RepID=UPI0025E52AC8|nr:NUDIX hydrolase [Pseudooctadecabacter sp.]
MTDQTDKSALRDAATVIVVRDRDTTPSILMGQRGATAAFLPNKFVFPGGAVDAGDAQVVLHRPLPAHVAARLAEDSALPPSALAAAAIREMWEETGQIIGSQAPWPDAPRGWRGFAATGHRPDPSRLEFVFRAVTPKGRPRRFDARFFLADARDLRSDPDDFSRAEDELSHLQWVPLAEARSLDLPFITEVVLAEIAAHLRAPSVARTVPFFRNDDEAHLVTRLSGRRPLDD